MKHFLSMAALAIVGTIMSSCSSSDEIVNAPQPESKTITQTITVNQDADAAETRAVDPTTGVKTFTADDKIRVFYKKSNNIVNAVTSSTCTLSDGGKKATFTVSFSEPKTDSPIRIIYPGSLTKTYPLQDFDITDDSWTISSNCYDNQDGTIDGENGLNKHALAVYDGALIGTDLPTNAMLKNRGTILALTIQNADGSADITSTIGKLVIRVSGESRDYTITPPSPATTFPDAPIYVAMRPMENKDITFTAYYGAGNANSVTKTVTSRTLARNNIYPVNLRMGTAKSLAALTADYEALNGDVLSGTLDGNYQVSIAAGATVTLDGVTINGANDENRQWAGITCAGDATIVLSGESTVKGFHKNYPAIYIAPDKTLTIQGTGKLTASPYDGSNLAAAIGGGNGIACGNIVIKGGTIEATGGQGAAIGSGRKASCGTITIEGGTIEAHGGGNSPGIGIGNSNGVDGSCGKITISGGTVRAYGGNNAAGIGCGPDGTCNDITISGTANVTATAGDRAAGIGSGNVLTKESLCGDITISGSATVTATGGYGGAGIGSGHGDNAGGSYKSSCGDITISDACTVNATGGNEAAGIGSGVGGESYESSCGDILIEGGTVTASTKLGCNSQAAGIGSGQYGKFNSITITSGITRVEATEEYPRAWPIGKGEFDQSGEVTVEIGGANISTGYTASERGWNGEGTSLTFTKKEKEGSLTWILTPAP